MSLILIYASNFQLALISYRWTGEWFCRHLLNALGGKNNFFLVNMQMIINIYSGEHSRLQTNFTQKKTNRDKNKKVLDWVLESVAG